MKKLPEFHNRALQEQAFTHRSFLNETKEKMESNERLEFLGDAILSFVVSRDLFDRYPAFNEGMLTNLRALLVNTKSLAQIAKELDFGSMLRLSRGEEESKGRENQSLLADSLEAFIGALYIDGGIDKVKTFIEEVLLPKAAEYVSKNVLKDPKSLLQEFVQSQKQSSPLYKVTKEVGPAHAKIFTVSVYIKNEIAGVGEGKSKQEAEEKAAKHALEKIEQK